MYGQFQDRGGRFPAGGLSEELLCEGNCSREGKKKKGRRDEMRHEALSTSRESEWGVKGEREGQGVVCRNQEYRVVEEKHLGRTERKEKRELQGRLIR